MLIALKESAITFIAQAMQNVSPYLYGDIFEIRRLHWKYEDLRINTENWHLCIMAGNTHFQKMARSQPKTILNFLVRKNRYFWSKLAVFGQKWSFSEPKGDFFNFQKWVG